MRLEDTFTVPAGHDRSWELLLDLPAVARCLPGAQLLSVEGETATGSVKVKLGPIVMTYLGELEFTERDPAAGVMAMRATGKDKRSAGSVTGSLRLVETGSSAEETRFGLEVDLDLTGKPAQFGRGAIQDVSSRLVNQFAHNLAALVDEPEVEPGPVGAGAAASPAPVPEAAEPFDALAGSRPPTQVLAAGGGALAALLLVAAWLLGRRGAR